MAPGDRAAHAATPRRCPPEHCTQRGARERDAPPLRRRFSSSFTSDIFSAVREEKNRCDRRARSSGNFYLLRAESLRLLKSRCRQH
jgi:hypothetical protein